MRYLISTSVFVYTCANSPVLLHEKPAAHHDTLTNPPSPIPPESSNHIPKPSTCLLPNSRSPPTSSTAPHSIFESPLRPSPTSCLPPFKCINLARPRPYLSKRRQLSTDATSQHMLRYYKNKAAREVGASINTPTRQVTPTTMWSASQVYLLHRLTR